TNIVIDDRGEELRRDSSQRHADATLTYLKTRGSSSKPFYIYIAPPVPHDPRVAPAEFHRLYDPAKIPLPAAFLPQHPWDNGEMAVRDEHLAPWPRTPEDTRQQLADYYATITAFDYQVGRVFAALKASGEWENTIVVFTSDNGLSMGEHGLFGKQNLYEFGGMHVPFVIAGPGIPQGKKSALVYLMDLLPTFAEIAGAPIPSEVEGKSLVAVIQGREDKVRDLLYTGYRDGQRAIRDQRWKLYRYPLVDRTQLFDLANDPHELKNLADDPKHAGKRAELTEKLKTEMARYGDTTPLVVANPAPAEWTAPPRKPW
ncbi:MAG TPA: sulfatase-like hydrolase/transferase, partial [Opitutaceae bacterium]|nr:sulfatase-like hydrolase/transferase [Opitutaceae bacterium]